MQCKNDKFSFHSRQNKLLCFSCDVGQIALHYWIAAFGTMESYASKVQLDQAGKEIKACVDEAKQQDEEFTKIAKEIMSHA